MSEKTIMELASGDSTAAGSRGSAISGSYLLEPLTWNKQINDAAQKKFYFSQAVTQFTLPVGSKEHVFPYRSDYLGTVRSGLAGSSGDWSVAVTNAGAAVTFTKLNNFDGVKVTPTDKSSGVAVTNEVIRTNAIQMMVQAKNELIYHAGDEVDQEVAYILQGATASTSSARGSQLVYGGDATSDNGLTAGDVLTPDMVADMKTRLKSRKCKYWSSGTEANSSQDKPPWPIEARDPFVLYLSSEQEGGLVKNSQFVNAAEYGGNEIILNGEIGRYLGIKFVVTENTPKVAASGTAPDGGSAPSVAMSRTILAKGKAAAGLCWAQKPKLHIFPYPRELEMDFVLEMSYAAATIHNDAVVFGDVADV